MLDQTLDCIATSAAGAQPLHAVRPEGLDPLLESLPSRPSAKNSFAYYQMLLAPSLPDFLTLAIRHPAAYNLDPSPETPDDIQKLFALKDYPLPQRACFVPDAAYILNSYTPLDLLKRAALSSSAANEPRFDLAQAAWTRAVLLKKYDLAQDLIPLLKSSSRSPLPCTMPLLTRKHLPTNSLPRIF